MTSKSLNPSSCWIIFIKQNYILLELIQSLIYKLTMTNWNSGLFRHPQLENISLQRNMKDRKFSIAKRLRSFKFALEGLKTVLREEHNARIHFGIAFFVIVF